MSSLTIRKYRFSLKQQQERKKKRETHFSVDVQIRPNQSEPAGNQSGADLDRMHTLIRAAEHQQSQNTHKQK